MRPSLSDPRVSRIAVGRRLAVSLFALAIGGAGCNVGGPGRGRTPAASAEVTTTFHLPAPPSDVAATGEQVWVVLDDDRVVRVDPQTGRIVASIPVPGGVYLAVGEG